jgi:DNA recombination protein RmuC
MSVLAVLLGVAVGIIVGAGVVAAGFARRDGARRATLEATTNSLTALQAERDVLRAAQIEDAQRIATLGAEHEATVRQLQEHRDSIDATIERVSHEVVRLGSERLSSLAAEKFEGATESLAKDLDLREERFKREVDPLRQLLERYNTSITELETKREGAYQSVFKHLEVLHASEERLRKETQSLVTALRTPTTKGRWGEMQLRRVVEMAGMVEHCDFSEQSSVDTDEGLQRPDMVVTLPDGAQVVIDAKVPLTAYLESLEAEDEVLRKDRLAAHARQLRDHVDKLSKKAYWKQFEPTPEFVVCFVPGESLLAAAFEADPGLVEQAMDSRVLLTGPVNLIALLKTVGLGWRQEALAENAREVQQLGQQLYERLGTFAGHLEGLGKALNRSVGAYNNAVGSLESRVLPAARQFNRLGVVGHSSDEIPSLGALEVRSREITAAEMHLPGGHPASLPHGDLHLVEPDDERDDERDGERDDLEP